jgi:hypothetical protein
MGTARKAAWVLSYDLAAIVDPEGTGSGGDGAGDIDGSEATIGIKDNGAARASPRPHDLANVPKVCPKTGP